MNPNQTVSLCMVVHDEETFLKRSLDSVTPIIDEIIIADQGSRDGTVELAKQYGATIIHTPWNQGIAEAKNAALRHSSGDWVLVLNAGEKIDTISQEKLKQLVRYSAKEGYYFKRKRTYKDDTATIERSFALFRNRSSYQFQGVWGEIVTLQNQNPEQVGEASDVIIHLSENGFDRLQRNVDVIAQYSTTHPNDPILYYWLGLLFFREGWIREACKEFEQAASCLESDFAYYCHTLYLLAQCYLMLQQAEKCLIILESALSLFPDFTDLYYLQGIAYIYGEQWKKATASIFRCASLPKSPLRYVSLENLQEAPCYLNAVLYSVRKALAVSI